MFSSKFVLKSVMLKFMLKAAMSAAASEGMNSVAFPFIKRVALSFSWLRKENPGDPVNYEELIKKHKWRAGNCDESG